MEHPFRMFNSCWDSTNPERASRQSWDSPGLAVSVRSLGGNCSQEMFCSASDIAWVIVSPTLVIHALIYYLVCCNSIYMELS